MDSRLRQRAEVIRAMRSRTAVISAKRDASRTLSGSEAYKLWTRVYGPGPITAFYVWRIRHRIPTAPGSAPYRPRFWHEDILKACGVRAEIISFEEARHLAHAAARRAK
jgi:hypothetical protein